MTDQLHDAVCKAVNILNTAPELCLTESGRQVRAILRQALLDYQMDQPTTEAEQVAMRRKHAPRKPSPAGHTSKGQP